MYRLFLFVDLDQIDEAYGFITTYDQPDDESVPSTVPDKRPTKRKCDKLNSSVNPDDESMPSPVPDTRPTERKCDKLNSSINPNTSTEVTG